MDGVAVRVVDNPLAARVEFHGLGPQPLISKLPLAAKWLGLDLRTTGLECALQRLGGAEFLGRLQRAADRTAAETLPITGDRTADAIPWEALVDCFDGFDPAEGTVRYVPVRQAAQARVRPQAPAVDEAPRILILVGEGDGVFEADAIIQRLRADAEAAGFDTAPGAVGRPAARILRLDAADAMTREAADLTPQFVMVYAHGRSDPPAVRASAGQWLPLGTLAGRFAQVPPYWAFIACSVGELDDLARRAAAFTALAAMGAVTVLAMRSRIRPETGAILFRDLFSRINAGESLEYAAAGARQTLLAINRTEGVKIWDWAAPSVWTRAEPGRRLRWTDGRFGDRVVLRRGLTALRAATKLPTLGLQVAAPEAVEQARRWRDARRVQVATPDGGVLSNPEAMGRLAHVLDAARQVLGCTVVAVRVDSSTNDYGREVRDWAQSAADLVPGADAAADEYASAVAAAARDAVEGLQRLCALPNVFVALLGAPTRGVDRAWVARVLAEAPAGATVVVCDDASGPLGDPGDWISDSVDDVTQLSDQARAAYAQRPEAVGLLALLPGAVQVAAIEALAGQSLEGVDLEPLVVRDAYLGVLLKDGARSAVLAQMGAEARQAVCARFVQRRSAGAAPRLRLAELVELDFLFRADRPQAAIELAEALAAAQASRWGPRDWLDLSRALRVWARAPEMVSIDLGLNLAQAHIERQEPDDALYWLDPARPKTELQAARRHMLMSEAFKGLPLAPAPALMRQHAREAVTVLDKAASGASDDGRMARRLLLAARANLARIGLYFDHEAEASAAEMRDVLAGYEGLAAADPDDASLWRDVAATRRNLAECLFEFAPFSADPERRQEARDLLERSRADARAAGAVDVEAEALYSLAKLSQAEAQLPLAATELEDCRTVAVDGGYAMLHRIAALRAFWVETDRGSSFDANRYLGLQRALDGFIDHAWAARYGLQSRVRAARHLAANDECAPARQLLDVVEEAYRDKPGLRSDGDVDLRITAAAGRRHLSERLGLGDDWDDFHRLPDVAERLNRRGDPAPSTIWTEAT